MLNIPMNFSRIFPHWHHETIDSSRRGPAGLVTQCIQLPHTLDRWPLRDLEAVDDVIYIYMIWIIYLLKIVIVHSYVSLPAAYHHSDSENRPIQTGKSYLSTPDSWQGGFLAAQDITQLFINSYWLCNNRRNMYRTHVFVCICSIWIIGVLIKSTLNPH